MAEVVECRVRKKEGDGKDELHNVIPRVKQTQYVQSSLVSAGLLLPANENLTDTSPQPSTLNMDPPAPHAHTACIHIIN